MSIRQRSHDEIVEKIRNIKNDIFAVKIGDLIVCLPYDLAKEFFRDDATEEDFNKANVTAEPKVVAKWIVDYLPFAWEKANDCRGLSALRSLDHFTIWMWLLGFDVEFDDYEYYGKQQLRAISECFGFDWRAHDNGRWVNKEGGHDYGVQDAASLEGVPNMKHLLEA